MNKILPPPTQLRRLGNRWRAPKTKHKTILLGTPATTATTKSNRPRERRRAAGNSRWTCRTGKRCSARFGNGLAVTDGTRADRGNGQSTCHPNLLMSRRRHRGVHSSHPRYRGRRRRCNYCSRRDWQKYRIRLSLTRISRQSFPSKSLLFAMKIVRTVPLVQGQPARRADCHLHRQRKSHSHISAVGPEPATRGKWRLQRLPRKQRPPNETRRRLDRNNGGDR